VSDAGGQCSAIRSLLITVGSNDERSSSSRRATLLFDEAPSLKFRADTTLSLRLVRRPTRRRQRSIEYAEHVRLIDDADDVRGLRTLSGDADLRPGVILRAV
jgi:hypothetical protein